MKPFKTWFWIFTAGVLFVFILLFHRPGQKAPPAPARVLPGLNAALVTNVQVIPQGGLEIRAFRAEGGWRLSQPLPCAAQALRVERFLAALEELTPAARIAEQELTNRFNADEEFGFASPQAAVVLMEGNHRRQLRLGARTAPGDQLFVQVVGVEGVFVVGSDLLKVVPRTATEWRDTTLVTFPPDKLDAVAVTNNAKVFVLRADGPGGAWRMTHPIAVRAHQEKIEQGLQKLQTLQVQQFVSDDPKVDLEPFGLQSPELALGLGQGTNTVAVLLFGKSPSNDVRQVYARRAGDASVVTVARDLLEPWYDPVNLFRDTHLISLRQPVESIDIRGEEIFSIERQTNGAWRLLPGNSPADPSLAEGFLSALGSLQIVHFVKDVVTPPDWPTYGLSSPARQYTLKAATNDPPPGLSNSVLVELSFGVTNADKVYVRRADESSVYAIKLADFELLPGAAWQFRPRKLWDFSANDVARVTIRQGARTRQLVHHGPHRWSLAPGSQGVINDLAVEEAVRGLAEASARVWVGRGEACRARCGFTNQIYKITMELTSGHQAAIEFGGEAPSTFPYAAVTIEGQPWVFEFPPDVFTHVMGYLSAPATP
jgi:hypothetical protein